ncbi:MAG: right-handed parallel beta-helix repeat-containing protein, partial [Bacteroidota bacterium]
PGPDAEAEFRAAMDAHVPGNVIRLLPGQYDFHTSLMILGNNDMRIEGAGPEQTLIRFTHEADAGGWWFRYCDQLVVKDLRIENQFRRNIIVDSSRGVHLSNLLLGREAFVERHSPACNLELIAVKDARVANCRLRNCWYSNLHVRDSERVAIDHTTVSGASAGMLVSNSSSVDITNSSVRDGICGIVLIADSEREPGYARNIRVVGNTIENNNVEDWLGTMKYLSIANYGTGIISVGVQELDIANNTIRNHLAMPLTITSLVNYSHVLTVYSSSFSAGYSISDTNAVSPRNVQVFDNTIDAPAPELEGPHSDFYRYNFVSQGGVDINRMRREITLGIQGMDASTRNICFSNNGPDVGLTVLEDSTATISDFACTPQPLPPVQVEVPDL